MENTFTSMVYTCDNREGGGGELDTFNNKNGNNASFMIINKTLR